MADLAGRLRELWSDLPAKLRGVPDECLGLLLDAAAELDRIADVLWLHGPVDAPKEVDGRTLTLAERMTWVLRQKVAREIAHAALQEASRAQAEALQEISLLVPGEGSVVERVQTLRRRVQAREQMGLIASLPRAPSKLSQEEAVQRGAWMRSFREQTNAGLKDARDALAAADWNLDLAVERWRDGRRP